MTNYPLHYEVKVKGEAGITKSWSGHGDQSGCDVQVAVPQEFDGSGAGFSPEELYALSLASCFVATFKVAAARKNLNYGQIHVGTKLTEERDPEGKPWMSECRYKVDLNGTKNQDEAKRLLEEISRECFILNSVRTKNLFEFSIS